MNRPPFSKSLWQTYAIVLTMSLLSVRCTNNSTTSTERHVTEPVITCDKPSFDKQMRAFTFNVIADSVEGANLTFLLIDGDSIMQQNKTGHFTGIEPNEDGYYVEVQADWGDTITKCLDGPYLGFIYKEPVEKMPKEELERLFNEDASELINNPHIIQDPRIAIINSQVPESKISNVRRSLRTGEWKSVKIHKVEYDEENRISFITLEPAAEELIVPDESETVEEFLTD